MQIFIQGLGIAAMALYIFSFQFKEKKRILTVQLFSSLLFAAHFGLIGAITGSLLNAIGALRALVFTSRPKKWAMHRAWDPAFFLGYAASYAMTFLVFHREPTVGNLLLELLPAIGMTVTHIAFSREKDNEVRLLSLVNSPLWLTYNCISGSIGGTLTETFSLISIIVAICRFDLKKRRK